MQAIETTYCGPTDHRGSRVIAKCEAGRVVVEWDYALNSDENHRAAAEALSAKLGWDQGWHGKMVSGGLPGRGWAHVFTGRE